MRDDLQQLSPVSSKKKGNIGTFLANMYNKLNLLLPVSWSLVCGLQLLDISLPAALFSTKNRKTIRLFLLLFKLRLSSPPSGVTGNLLLSISSQGLVA